VLGVIVDVGWIRPLVYNHTNSLMFLRISPLENTLYLRVDNWLSQAGVTWTFRSAFRVDRNNFFLSQYITLYMAFTRCVDDRRLEV